MLPTFKKIIFEGKSSVLVKRVVIYQHLELPWDALFRAKHLVARSLTAAQKAAPKQVWIISVAPKTELSET